MSKYKAVHDEDYLVNPVVSFYDSLEELKARYHQNEFLIDQYVKPLKTGEKTSFLYDHLGGVYLTITRMK